MSADAALFPYGDALIAGEWRYWLTRTWDEDGPVLCYVMLNPSKADGQTDDPTITRCRKRAMLRQWRGIPYGGIVVVNLFAYRATDPKELHRAPWRDRVGPDNDRHILERARAAHTVVAAWSADAYARERAAQVLALLPGVELFCLGITESGAPKHPLYVSYDTPLIPYPWAGGPRCDTIDS